MKVAKNLRERINTILDIPKTDIADEVMEKVLDGIHGETLITPAEVEDIFGKEMHTARSILYGAMKCATLQCCHVETSNYCLPKKDQNMIAFQNPGFLYTLAQHIFYTLRTDWTVDDVLSHDSEKTDTFWQKCEDLLMCRFAQSDYKMYVEIQKTSIYSILLCDNTLYIEVLLAILSTIR